MSGDLCGAIGEDPDVAGRGGEEALLADVVAFAEGTDNIRAVIVTGSTARGEAHPLSDLDLELYVRDPQRLLVDESWYARFGHVVAVEALQNPDWYPTRLLYLAGARKIDFMVAPVTALDAVRHDRPFAVVVDKDGSAANLPPPDARAAPLPTPAEFTECLNWFSAAAIMCAKAITRDDLWTAKVRDWDLKRQLLRMIEWDHRVRHGPDYDTWYLGKNMRLWMDAAIQVRVARCWGRFDTVDSLEALTASVDLFHDLAPRVGKAISAAPFDHAAVADEVNEILLPARGTETGAYRGDT